MSDVWGSPSDPVFWMHHSFIDHSWRIWQNADGARIQGIDGTDAAGNTLTLDTMVYMGGIRPDVPISAIINTLGGVEIGGVPFCYRYNY
jgi:tyrosinase